MCDRESLKKMLDQIPVEYDYEFVQMLKDMHHEFHLARGHEQPIVFLANSNMTDDEIRQMAAEIGEPTHLAKALNIFNEINYAPLFTDGTETVLAIALKIYSTHNPPSVINHPRRTR